jgi:hypothetical protein
VRGDQLGGLGESLEGLDSLLNLRKTATCFIVIFLNEEEVALSGLVQNKELHDLQ